MEIDAEGTPHMHTQVVLFDGFDPLDAIAPYEVLYAGGSATDGAVTVELVTAEGPRPREHVSRNAAPSPMPDWSPRSC